ncbi:MAG: GNAT family N-acetyltransferase [Gemmatimonadota bacterium]
MTGLDRFLTTRLAAERLRPEHKGEIHRAHQDPVQMATLGGVKDEAGTAAYMKVNLEHWDRHGFGIWLLRDRQDGKVAGRALLRHLLIEEQDEVEVGYSFYPAYWGRGLATEAAAACLDIARDTLRLPSVVAVTLPTNQGSQQVMTRIGMYFEREYDHAGLPHVLFRIAFADSGGVA